MSTELTWQTSSTSSEETERLGAQIGAKLRGGEILELRSDVGGGKTTFVRGLAQGAGSTEQVASPSFTVSREYKTPRFRLLHFDFYRLTDPGIIANELAEYIGDNQVVIVVEWADIVEDILPVERMRLTIKPMSETERLFEISYPQALAYLTSEYS